MHRVISCPSTATGPTASNYVVKVGILTGNRELGPGEGFLLPAEQVYAYQARAEGVALLELRNLTSIAMRVCEKDMAVYRSKAISSIAGASR